MSDREIALQGLHEIECEMCGRRHRSRIWASRSEQFQVGKEHMLECYEAGWRCWDGRSRRWYCPDHSPRPGHRMTEMVPSYCEVCLSEDAPDHTISGASS